MGIVVWLEDQPVRVARQQLEQGRVEDALHTVNAFLRERPDAGSAWEVKGRCLVALQRYGEAQQIFERYGAHDAAALHDWAKTMLAQRQWSAALPTLETLLKRNPRDPDLLHETTACRSYLGRADDALASATTLSTVPGFESRGFVQVAVLQDERGNYKQAVEAWASVARYDPELKNLPFTPAEYYLSYGKSLLQAGSLDRATEALERSVSLKPMAETHLKLAEAKLGRDAQAAESHLREVVRMEPAHVEARAKLAELSLQQKHPDAAHAWLEPVLVDGQAPSSRVAYLSQRIAVLKKDAPAAARWQEQVNALRKQEQFQSVANYVLRDEPRSFWAQVIRARKFAEERNWGEAESLIRQLAREAPQEQYVQALATAIQTRSTLPSLEGLPVKLH